MATSRSREFAGKGNAVRPRSSGTGLPAIEADFGDFGMGFHPRAQGEVILGEVFFDVTLARVDAWLLRSGGAQAAVAQAADFVHGNDFSIARRFDLSGEGRVSIQRQVGPGVEVIANVGRHHAAQMVFVENQRVVQTLPADGADGAFHV